MHIEKIPAIRMTSLLLNVNIQISLADKVVWKREWYYYAPRKCRIDHDQIACKENCSLVKLQNIRKEISTIMQVPIIIWTSVFLYKIMKIR